jgi:hypothetical protein
MDFLRTLPIEIMFVLIASFGGVARYLNGYTNGAPFKFSVFLASALVAGFSGWMFALFGHTMGLSHELLYVMAGTGGFFGEQSLKFLMEHFTRENRKE